MIKAIVRQQTFLFSVVFEWEVFERSYYKSFCSYHFRNMRFENPVPFLCKSVISGATTTYVQAAEALGKCVVSLFKEGEEKIVVYTFFLSHFIAFPCFDFCSVNSITCTYFDSNSIISSSSCSSNKLIFVFQLRAIHERD